MRKTIVLSDETCELVEAMSNKMGVNFSEAVRRLLEHGLFVAETMIGGGKLYVKTKNSRGIPQQVIFGGGKK